MGFTHIKQIMSVGFPAMRKGQNKLKEHCLPVMVKSINRTMISITQQMTKSIFINMIALLSFLRK